MFPPLPSASREDPLRCRTQGKDLLGFQDSLSRALKPCPVLCSFLWPSCSAQAAPAPVRTRVDWVSLCLHEAPDQACLELSMNSLTWHLRIDCISDEIIRPNGKCLTGTGPTSLTINCLFFRRLVPERHLWSEQNEQALTRIWKWHHWLENTILSKGIILNEQQQRASECLPQWGLSVHQPLLPDLSLVFEFLGNSAKHVHLQLSLNTHNQIHSHGAKSLNGN